MNNNRYKKAQLFDTQLGTKLLWFWRGRSRGGCLKIDYSGMDGYKFPQSKEDERERERKFSRRNKSAVGPGEPGLADAAQRMIWGGEQDAGPGTG